MKYDQKLYIEIALTRLEHDIDWVASRYYIPGYDFDDLKQELRLELLNKLKMFDHTKGIKLRSWADSVMRNRLGILLRESKTKKRGGDCEMVDFDKVCRMDLGIPDDFIEFLDKINELGLDLDDFM